jgi:molecular chaperone GrpE
VQKDSESYTKSTANYIGGFFIEKPKIFSIIVILMNKDDEIKEQEELEVKDMAPEIPQEDEDDIVEFVYNEDGEEDLKATLKKLRKDIKEARKEKAEYLDGWQRAKADYQNYKNAEGERLISYAVNAKERMIDSLLPALDSFDMAMMNKEAWEKVDQNWRTGVEYIYNQFLTSLGDNGVSTIDKVDVSFDPNLHQSIETLDTDDESKDHTIAKIIQKGYKMGDRIIRPARVVVYIKK